MVQTLDIISVNIWNIIVSLANLAIIYFILKKLLFGPVKKVLAERQKAVDTVYDEADRTLAEANESKELYENRLASAEEEANVIVEEARTKAKKVSDSIISDANEKANAALRRAEDNIALEKRKAVNEMKDEISDISVEIAEKIIGRELTDEDRSGLVDSFIDSLGD